MKLKLEQCKCGKTISKFNGNLEEKICDVCSEKNKKEESKRRLLRGRFDTPQQNLERLSMVVE